MNSQADLRATGIERGQLEVSFDLIFRNQSLGRIVVGMPGNHNVLNALAAISVGLELDIGIEQIKEGIRNLGGLERRFQVKGEKGDILVLDDYGHHPTEVSATLQTAKECWPEKRLIVVFQPHRYSRTKALFDRFVLSFNQADILIMAPIYSAGEAPIEGVNAEWLYQGIKEHGHKDVILCESPRDILEVLLDLVRPGDTVMTLGAGDIFNVGEALLKRLGHGSKAKKRTGRNP
jgi:UDP-N-acetylmuramate--alanine ligase